MRKLLTLLMAGAVALTGAATEYTIAVGETMVLDGTEYSTSDTFTINGTLDLNGHDLSIKSFGNAPANAGTVLRTNMTARIVNSGANATITVSAGCKFYGTIENDGGGIDLKVTGGTCMVFSPAGVIAPRAVSMGNPATLMTYTQYQKLKFVFSKSFGGTGDSSDFIQLSQIQPTYRGLPVRVSSVEATETRSGKDPNWLIVPYDATKIWSSPNGVTLVTVTLTLPADTKVDGYRLGTAYYPKNDPQDWDVYGYRYTDAGWVHLDHRVGEAIRPAATDTTKNDSFSGQLTPNYELSFADRPADALAADTPIDFGAAGILRAITTEPFKLGVITGNGALRMDSGSEISVADMSGFQGKVTAESCADIDHMAKLLLRGGESENAQTVMIRDAKNISVENETSDTLATVLFDDRTAANVQYGRLADGEGTLGVVKNGTGRQVLATQDAAYTGETAVREGTLCVTASRSAEPIRIRRIRIRPTAVYGNDMNNVFWGLRDAFIYDADGEAIAWPSAVDATTPNGFHVNGPKDNLFDNDQSTKTLVKGGSATDCPPVDIILPEPMEIFGYGFKTLTTSDVNDKNRTVMKWVVFVSETESGEDWVLADERTGAWTAEQVATTTTPRNPGVCEFKVIGSDVADSLCTIDNSVWGTVGAYDSSLQALKARYFRFTPHETLKWNASTTSFGWQIAELELLRNGEEIEWDTSKVVVSSTAGMILDVQTTALANFANNDETDRFFAKSYGSVTVDAGEQVEFDGYQFVSAADLNNRLPVSWTFEISADGENWVTVDRRHRDHQVQTGSRVTEGPWSVSGKFPLLSAGRPNAVGDESLVRISNGATFEVAGTYEKVGGLAGDGAVVLDKAKIDLDGTDRAATFAGTIDGRYGTSALRISGDQALNDVTVSGVGRLELAAGNLSGTGATFSGEDLTVDFSGGVLGTTLGGIGVLTVTGTPVVAIPEPLPREWCMTLFTFESMDADSKAILETAVPSVPLSRGRQFTVTVKDKAVVAKLTSSGLVLMVR